MYMYIYIYTHTHNDINSNNSNDNIMHTIQSSTILCMLLSLLSLPAYICISTVINNYFINTVICGMLYYTTIICDVISTIIARLSASAWGDYRYTYIYIYIDRYICISTYIYMYNVYTHT